MKKFVQILFQLIIKIAYAAYKVEGLNALLIFLPAKMIPLLLKQHGAVIGQAAEIHSPLIIHNANPEPGRHYANLRIGNECYLGREVFLDLKDLIPLEDQVTISMRVMLITHTDAGRSPVSNRLPPSHGPIVLRRGAYIGAGATILQGVEVGSEGIGGCCCTGTRECARRHDGGGRSCESFAGKRSSMITIQMILYAVIAIAVFSTLVGGKYKLPIGIFWAIFLLAFWITAFFPDQPAGVPSCRGCCSGSWLCWCSWIEQPSIAFEHPVPPARLDDHFYPVLAAGMGPGLLLGYIF